MLSEELQLGDILFYGRCIPNVNIYDVLELKIRTVRDDDKGGWFVGLEKKDGQAFLFSSRDIGRFIFRDRKECLAYVKEKERTTPKKCISNETYYDDGMEA